MLRRGRRRRGRGSARAAYRGPDRRARIEDAGTADVSVPVAGVLVFGSVGVLGWAALRASVPLASPTGMAGIRSAALVLALLLAVTAHLHWRATGEAGGASIGTAGWLLFAVSAVDVWSGPVPEVGWQLYVRSAISTTAAILAYRAITGSEVDSHARPMRQLLLACIGAVPIALMGVLLGSISFDPTVRGILLHATAASAWCVAAAFGLQRTARNGAGLVGWVALLATAIGASEILSAIALVGAPGWLFASVTARAAGFLVLAFGSIYGLSRATIARRRSLHQEQLRNQRQAYEATTERELRTHELRNALLAIEGATVTLQRYREDLPSEERHLLDDAVTGGIDHLRSLLDPVAGISPVTAPFSVVDVAAGRASLARSRGVDIEVTGDPDLRTRCPQRILAQIVDNLVANAERHAGSEDRDRLRVAIEVTGDADTVRLRVRDNGAGVPAALHELIFEPGVRLEPSRRGDGLGLHLSRQLARQYGGDLRSREYPQGGSFELTLPRVISDGGRRPTDVGKDGGEVVEALSRR